MTDDKPHDLTAPSLADQLEAAGFSWRVYAENYPGGCFTGPTSLDGADGKGDYRRKHNPAISFTAISGDRPLRQHHRLLALRPGRERRRLHRPEPVQRHA